MSNSIEERVVEMQFDNKHFEKNIKVTMDSLNRLDNALNLQNGVKGFQDIDKAVRKVDVSNLSNSVEKVKVQFSALQIAGVTAITNITNSIINLGAQLAKSLSIDQIDAGFSKYAQKTSAVQTIMAATRSEFENVGNQMDQVSDQLQRLNWFTDETSYNFVDMVGNIGKFTSNNIALDKSVTAMEGIAVWAGLSGANAQEASRAMYNLAQAISVGSVKLIDWKSIENANMATAEFKQTAIDTAVALGTLKDEGNGLYTTLKGNSVSVKNFNEALSDSWFSSEVLLKTLNKFGGFTDALNIVVDETGILTSELIDYINEYSDGTIDLEQASKDLGLSVADTDKVLKRLSSSEYELGRRAFAASQEAKTFGEAIDSVKDAVSTGWMNTFELLFGNYEKAKTLWTELANRLYDVFAASGEARNELLEGWAELGGRDSLIQSIWNVWDAVAKAINSVKDGFNDIFPAAFPGQLYSITKNIERFTEKLIISDKTAERLRRVFKALFSVLKIETTTTKTLFRIFSKIVSIFDKIISKFSNFIFKTNSATSALEKFQNVTEKISIAIEVVGDILLYIIDSIGDFILSIGKIRKSIIEFARTSSVFSNIITIFIAAKNAAEKFLGVLVTICGTAIFTGLSAIVRIFEKVGPVLNTGLSGIINILNKVKSIITEFVSGTATKVSKKIDELREAFRKFYTESGADEQMNKMTAQLSLFKEKFVAIIDVIIEKIKEFGLARILLVAYISSMVYAFVGITKSVKSVSKSVEKVANAAAGINTVYSTINTSISSISGAIQAANKTPLSTSILKMAQAVAILAASLTVLTLLPQEKLLSSAKVLSIVTIVLGGVAAAMAAFPVKQATSAAALATTLMALAGGVAILSVALKKLEEVEIDGLFPRLATLAGLITIFAAFSIALSKFAPKFSASSIALIGVAVSIKYFVNAFTSITDENLKTIKDNILTLIGIFSILSILFISAGQIKLGSAVGVIATAAAVSILCKAIKSINVSFKDVDINELKSIQDKVQGILILTVGLTAVLYTLLKNLNLDISKLIFNIGASILMASVGVFIIVKAINAMSKYLSDIAPDQISKSLISLVGIFALIAFVSVKAKEASKEAGIAFAGFGIGVLAISNAMKALKDTLNNITGGEIAGITITLIAMLTMFKIVSMNLSEAKNAMKSIIAISAAIYALVILASIVSILNWNQLGKAAGVVVGIVVLIAAISSGLKALSSLNNNKAALAIASLTASILAIAGALYVLSNKVKTDKLEDSALSLIAIIMSLTVFMAGAGIVSQNEKNAKRLVTTIVAMIGLLAGITGSILMIVYAMRALEHIEIDKIMSTVAAIGLLYGAFAALAIFIGKSNDALKIQSAMLAMAISMDVFAVGIALITTAFGKLAGIDWKTILSAGAAITLITSALSLLGILIGDSGLGLVGVPVLAASFLLLAYACKILAPAMTIMAEAFSIGLESIGAFIIQLTTAFDNLTLSISNMVDSIFNAVEKLSIAAINFATAINMIIEALFKMSSMSSGQALQIASNFIIIGYGIGTSFGVAVASAIISSITAIVAAIGSVIKALIEKFTGENKLFSSCGEASMMSYASGLMTNKRSLQLTGASLIKYLIKGVSSNTKDLNTVGQWSGISFARGVYSQCDNASGAGVALGSTFENALRDTVDVHSPSKKLFGIGDWTGISFVKGVINNSSGAFDAGSDLGGLTISGIMSTVDEFANAGSNCGSAFLSELWGKVKNGIARISGTVNSVDYNTAVSSAFKEARLNDPDLEFDTFEKEYRKKYQGGSNSADGDSKSIFDRLDDVQKEFDNVGSSISDSMGSAAKGSSGASKSIEEVKTVAKEAAEEIVDYGDYFNIFSYAGKQVESFNEQYKSTLSTIDNVNPIQASKNAIELFALSLYEDSGKMQTANDEYRKSVDEVLETEMTATERSQKLADLKAEHIKKRTQEIQEVYEEYISSVKSGIQNDIDMLSEFSNSDESTMDDQLDNMQSQIDALNTWEYKMQELAKRDDMTPELFQYLIDKGYKNGYNLVNNLYEASVDQFEEFKDKFNTLEGGTLSDSVSNSLINSMVGLRTGLAQAGANEIEQAVFDIDKALGEALDKVNPDEELGSKLKESMSSSFKVAIDEVITDTSITSDKFKSIGDAAAQGLAIGIKNGVPYVIEPAKEIGEAAKNATMESIDAHSPSKDFEEIGGYTILGFVAGVTNGLSLVENAMSEVALKAKEAFINILGTGNFIPNGEEIIGYITNGISDDFSNIKNAIAEAINKARLELSSLAHDQFYIVGQQIVQGMIDGLVSKIDALREAARELAETTEFEIEDELDINSPSKKLYKTGSYAGEGFVNGLKSYVHAASNAAKLMADDTISVFTDSVRALATAMVEDYDEPTITPVLDLSEIQNGSKSIGSLLNKNSGFNLFGSNTNARMAANDFNASNRNSSVSNSNGTQTPTYSFTQNNYSPKALSRIDIYRQTKNQFSALKGTT